MSKNKQSSVEKDFVPYEEALALKELGFDEPCFGWYQVGRLKKEYHPLKENSGNQSYMVEDDCNAPTFSQAFRWFRERYNLHHEIWFEYLGYVSGMTANIFKTYEEAELACLRKLIEILNPRR